MDLTREEEIRQNVRDHYQKIAVASSSCCSSSANAVRQADFASAQLGYSEEELRSVPEGSNLGLGCGNPQAIAALSPGETVLDLGSGAGFDCFLAGRQVGEDGRVIGVEMTPDMIAKARGNAHRSGMSHVEFRLGEIEHLPAADASVDVMMSNCVVNLSPDKPQVFREAFRVLRSGGRLAISDIVTTAELPSDIKGDLKERYAGCISGASSVDELTAMLQQSGFVQISIEPKEQSRSFIRDWLPGAQIDDYICSAVIQAVKP
ncbi:arsenite S-adenosylmethyltransferase [Saccharibacillus sp. O23]|uniref:arsenite methyltransferase n=1 Tax=Saccharibacillus sp. O23 TaxID=2009338 RepID=UPI000B4DF73D|nr:arsenite methyltransferase [Saccharibacillus sp. O23]OWR30941.1 arsenite S-adenosylmethyltransferase [Saccharibacillus sp. O23]